MTTLTAYSQIDKTSRLDETENDVKLFNAQNIDYLDWPDTQDGQYARKYIEPLIKNGIQNYVGNLQVKIFALKIADYVLPIAVADEGQYNSYICSPYDHYVSYGRDSVGLVDNRFILLFIQRLLDGLGKLAQIGKMNSVVYVNHWLFSLDLYPEGFSQTHIEMIIAFLEKLYPRHAIIFRSTNSITCEPLQKSFKNLGFHLILSRYIHVTDTKNESIFSTRIIKSDLKLFRESTYSIVDETELSEDTCQELLRLYSCLYIEQHSQHNPKYTLRFVKHLFQNGLLQFKVLKLGTSFKGVAGYYERNGIMMCPFFGYDKTDPDHTVIYRMLSTALLLEAKKRKILFHQSAGATFYKKIRRAQGAFESMAVYTKHLPLRQKFSWSVFNFIINTFSPKYMKKY